MDDVVSGKVNGPGIALILFGLITLFTNVLSLAWQGFTTVTILLAGDVDYVVFLTSQGWVLVLTMFSVIAGLLITVGGVRLRQQRSPGMVYAAAALAMLPCCVGWCCCFGLPVGGWVLLTMNDDQVKGAFEG